MRTGSVWPDTGVSHQWEKDAEGHWSTVCEMVVGRWSGPYEREDAEPCQLCETEARLRPETEAAVRSFLGHRWPRAFTLSDIRKATPEGAGASRTMAAIRKLIDERLIFAYYGDGRRRLITHYAAGRKLVEAVGRVYGVTGLRR